MKALLKQIIFAFLPCIHFFLCIFFDKKYLRGKHFDKNLNGYIFSLKSLWVKNILRLNKPMPFPTGLTCLISNPLNIHFHPDDLNNFQSPGTYFQNFNAQIYIGKGSYIAPNVGIITANHDLADLDTHMDGSDVIIGEKCWIGMNSVILPGVELGNRTIVAAGTVVTKSFKQGNIVLGGVPAKIIKEIN
ncbi:acyltransferase [Acinetobacter calcoaceticus]|uniref:acyltransferase n=1 Tax=Acinetobacter calcoaceticus TaxID=471 RepID=UPI00321B4D3A